MIQSHRLPHHINKSATLFLHYKAQNYPTLAECITEIKALGWNIYVVDQSKGICHYHKKFITVPIWTHNLHHPKVCNDEEYRIYYLAHELAHTRAGFSAHHGQKFMRAFMYLCPQHLWKYEIGYKPRNARKAGIFDI